MSTNTESKTRKPNGEGHTYPHRGGYRTVIRNQGRLVSATGKTERESRSRAKAKLRALPPTVAGLIPGGGRITVGEFLLAWLQHRHQHRIAPTTYLRYMGLAEGHIAPAIGHLQLEKLTKRHVNAMIDQMAAAGQSPRSQQQARAILSVAMQGAVEDDLIAFNPVKGSRKVQVRSKEIRPLSSAEVDRLLSESEGTLLHARLRIALLYGLRQGEALGLRWCDIDLKHGSLQVRKQLQRVSGEPRFVDLKTRNSQRTLPLDAVTIAALTAHRKLVDQFRSDAAEAWEDHDLVFPNKFGKPAQTRWDHEQWLRALAAAGIERRRLHDARHTAATLLYDGGVDIEVIRRFLGHSSVELTARTYVHHSDRALRSTLDVLSRPTVEPVRLTVAA